MRRRRSAAQPAGVSDTLHLAVDPQLVHDLAESLPADVRDERAKILRFVPATQFHSIEDESGVFAQRMHNDVSVILPVRYDCRMGVLVGKIYAIEPVGLQ